MGSTDVYFVLTCGDSIGNAGRYLETLCAEEDDVLLRLQQSIAMPENYIALFCHLPPETTALRIIDQVGKRNRPVSPFGFKDCDDHFPQLTHTSLGDKIYQWNT